MIRLSSLSELKEHVLENKPDVLLTMGNFDGLHVGHRALLAAMRDHQLKETEKKTLFVVLTFTPHPLLFFQKKSSFLLYNLQERRTQLANLGVDVLVEIPFDEGIASLPPKEFLEQKIFPYVCVKSIFWGHDFCFGAQKLGTYEWMQHYVTHQAPYSIQLHYIAAQFFGWEVVSSSRVRNSLQDGRIEECTALLQRYYSMTGVVVKGDQRGRTIGFPTANVIPDRELIAPKRGVYGTFARIPNGEIFQAMTNIGTRPTFKGADEQQVVIETHLLNYNGDLYGKDLQLFFVKFLRDEKKFDGIEALKAQLNLDREQVKEVLKGFDQIKLLQ